MTGRAAIAQPRTTSLREPPRLHKEIVKLASEQGGFGAGVRTGGRWVHLKRMDERDPSLVPAEAGEHFRLHLQTDGAPDGATALFRKGGRARDAGPAHSLGCAGVRHPRRPGPHHHHRRARLT